MSSLTSQSAFFYGTLMAPSVLTRVIGRRPSPPFSPSSSTSGLSFHPALLPEHRRHRVRSADYPAVRPCPSNSVRGTFVSGLSSTDIERLDLFEGDEYERRAVRVRLLSETAGEGGVMGQQELSTNIPAAVNSEDGGVEELVQTQTYIWTAPVEQLEEGEWDFEHFTRERLHLWAGKEARDEGLLEVDRQYGSSTATAADSTRGRGVMGGQFEKAVQEKHVEVVRSAV